MSRLEDQVEKELIELGVEYHRQYQFHATRKWKADFAIWCAFPESHAFFGKTILLEIEGGEFSGGRHTRGTGLVNDCIKYNEAVMCGYIILRFSGLMVKRGDVKKYLQENVLTSGSWVPESIKPKRKPSGPKLEFRKDDKKDYWRVYHSGDFVGSIMKHTGYYSAIVFTEMLDPEYATSLKKAKEAIKAALKGTTP